MPDGGVMAEPKLPTEFLPEPVVFGKYLILGRIGKGGMAEVYLARPRGQRRLLAIKVIHSALATDKQYVNMFINEGKLAVLLNHDAIVKTYEIGRIRNRHFICMEYVSGVDLSVLLRRRRSSALLRVPHALYVAQRICEGLHYAHELTDVAGKSLNLVNRDVSPSNVRISFDGDVKLLDFGIAKAKTGLSSEIGTLKGKFSHMSPEQVRGLPLDRRSDVFSSGIVLHEMLTQEKLFRGDSEFQVMDMVRRADVRPPSANNPRVPPEVDALVLKALQKNPADRFQSAGEMAAVIREALARYNFSKAELRDLVRDACSEEWAREQQTIEAGLRGHSRELTPVSEPDEDYGTFEVYSEDAREVTRQALRSRHPTWIYVLLSVAIGLLVLAIVLLFVLGKGSGQRPGKGTLGPDHPAATARLA